MASPSESGIAVAVWDVEAEENMATLMEWGIDAVVTDYPSLFVDHRESVEKMLLNETSRRLQEA